MKLLCVDIDGVVITGRAGDGAHWSTDLEPRFGITRAQLSAQFFKPHWSDIVTGRKPLRPALDQALARIPNAPGADDLIAFWFATDAALNMPLLDALAPIRQHTRVVLATNQEPQRSAYIWDTLGLSQHFDALYSSAALGVAKPDPGFFRAIEARENLAPTDIGFIDDSAENCAAAQALSWQSAHVPHPDQAANVVHLSFQP